MRLIGALGLLVACAPSGVRFEVVAPGLDAGEVVYVAGSPAEWGGWRPDGVALAHAGGDWWTGMAPASDGVHEFKFTLGSWEREGLKPNGFQRDNAVVQVRGGRAVVQDTVWGWSSGVAPRELKGQVTGAVDSLGLWAPPGLLPRLVSAWVPPGERIDEVVVLHDGQNAFDPARANFGVDWGVDDTLMAWSKAGCNVLAVAVDCSEERSSDYGPGPEGRQYVEWLANSVVPEVKERYGVGADVPVTLVGASMGGLISAIGLVEHPEAFQAAVCMSPAFAYRGFSYPDSLAKREWPAAAGPMWIDNGTVGLEAELQPGVDAMADHLASTSAVFTVERIPEGRHFEADWGRRFGAALRWVQAHRAP